MAKTLFTCVLLLGLCFTACKKTTAPVPPPPGFVEVQGGNLEGYPVQSFYMDKYEITQTGYEAVMGVNPAYFQTVSNAPVERVSWFKAIEYCNRRSLQEGLSPCYTYANFGSNPDDWPEEWCVYSINHSNIGLNISHTGYRLPTEAEWFYAARGGRQSHDYIYSGSNDLNEVAWCWENWGISHLSTHAVGALAPNELGIYDMSGNVWEWCWDVHSGSNHAHRGGSWVHDALTCAVSFRSFNDALYSSHYIGFRVVRKLTS